MVMQGITKRYRPEKGYGFIIPQDGSDDLFFHISNVSRGSEIVEIPDGCCVEFDVRPVPNGKNAGKNEAIKISFVDED
jgi:cold shock protein